MANITPSPFPIQAESAETGAPTSESLFFAMGGTINYLLNNKASVGDILISCLDEPTFQSQHDTTWVLCNGRDVTGSDFNSLTGLTNIPDLRGCVPRGKDNGRALDPHGDQAIGTFQPDQMLDHVHIMADLGLIGSGLPYGSSTTSFGGVNIVDESFATPVPNTSHSIPAQPGGNITSPSETNAKSTVVNFFVKINS